jgi:hypothetical protein
MKERADYMKTILRFLALSLLTAPSLFSSSPVAATEIKNKEEAVASIEKRKAEMIKLSDQIWAFAETALREHKSSKALSDYAEQQGFKVERGVAGMPTAFVATYGQGRPVIGILGEFDALPGISQKASPVKEPLEAGAPGHGCGHNLFGVASLGAAVAVKELIAVVACGGMSIGHKGMMLASKTLAATMVDLFEDAKARETIQAEFKEKTKGFVYKPYVQDGPPPLPKE